MLFEQDNKLCKEDLTSLEQHIKLSERVKKNKTYMSLPRFRTKYQRVYLVKTTDLKTKISTCLHSLNHRSHRRK